MRPNWSSIFINALILVVAFIAGYAIHGGPKMDGNPVGPVNYNAVTPTSLTSNPSVAVATNCITGATSNCTLSMHIETSVSPSPAPAPSTCPTVAGSGCFVIGGQMQSVDAAGLKETVNLTETLDFQSHQKRSLTKTARMITPNADDGNPVGFRSEGQVTIGMTPANSWPQCMKGKQCYITIDLVMPILYCQPLSAQLTALRSLETWLLTASTTRACCIPIPPIPTASSSKV